MLSVFILGTSLLVSATGRPHEKHADIIQPSSKDIAHTGAFGGTYNFAQKKERSTQTSIDHSKYEVYEPEEYEKGTIGEHVYGEGGDRGHGKGQHYYGHYGSHAQREYAKEHEQDEHKVEYGKYGKGTYGHAGSGYQKESDIHGGPGSHGGLGHHDSEDEYGYHTSGRKEDHRGTGYHVTEEHYEHKPKLSSGIAEYNEHRNGVSNEDKNERIDSNSGIADIISEIDEERKLLAKVPTREYGTVESQSEGKGAHETTGDKGLGDYTSGKYDHQLQESSNIGEYKVHESHEYEDKISTEKREMGGLGEYASDKHEEDKHGMKSPSGIAHGNQDHNDFKGAYVNKGNMEKVENGGLGDYSSGVYDARKQQGGYDHPKYGAPEEERKNDERILGGGNEGYEIKELEGYHR